MGPGIMGWNTKRKETWSTLLLIGMKSQTGANDFSSQIIGDLG